MNWNEAMLAQAQGWGEMQIGRRPHHQRPHLLQGGSPPASELMPDDGLSPQERARRRVADRAAEGRSSPAPVRRHQSSPSSAAPSRVVQASDSAKKNAGSRADHASKPSLRA